MGKQIRTTYGNVVYDYDEAAKFIARETGISKKVILQVLNAEITYMKRLGLIEDEPMFYNDDY